jgi:hypothetical protein
MVHLVEWKLKTKEIKMNSIDFNKMILKNIEKNKIIFGDGYYFKKQNDFIGFCGENNLTISDETNGKYTDGHNGYICNKLVSEIVYNKLVDDYFISYSKIKTDWKSYKDFDLNKKIKLL